MLQLEALLFSVMSLLTPSASASDEISFNRDVRPILSDRCFLCHGPDAENQDSDFRLDTAERATADLGGYVGIAPGNLEQSELHRRIWSKGDDRMPPPDSKRSLADEEKRMLDAWIEAGAPFDAHWSFQPLPAVISVPHVKGNWPRNEIDQFVLNSLRRAGLEPNVEAPREKWLRRVTFDLTGLPPTPEEIDAFLADFSYEAFERVVERLLANPACAERLTSEWLDVARYSDSYGYQRDDERYVWPWRDWVIRAFQTNMPYDEFITCQLAGDLLPDANVDQILATTFNRLHSHKKEGGIVLEEFRIEYVADRTQTAAAAFLGLTFECARCHDHKYDPITMKDYYQLSSFFANIDERGQISYFTDAVPTPAMPLPSEAQTRALAQASAAVKAALQKCRDVEMAAQGAFQRWLDSENRHKASAIPDLVAHLDFAAWHDADPKHKIEREGPSSGSLRGLANIVSANAKAVSSSANRLVSGVQGNGVELTGDDPIVLPDVGQFARHQPFTISLWINTPEMTERAVIYRRSRGWDDAGSMGYELVKEGARLNAKLCHFWPGNAICVETTDVLAPGDWRHVAVTYDGSSRAKGLKIYLDGAPAETTIIQDHLTRTITQWTEGYYDFAIGSRYRDRGFIKGKIDELRIIERTVSALEVRQLHDLASLDSALPLPADELTQGRRSALWEYYLSAQCTTARKARADLAATRAKKNAIMDSIPAISVMREQASPRPAYVLDRGAYDQRGEQVWADTPSFLPDSPEGVPRNRIGLARWLTSHDHPLTARVAVNRYWQLIFGQGLVATPEDFGNQGQPPSHPELLDWLARDFVDGGWDVRRLLRQLVLSSTYRQSAIVPLAVRQKDSENRLLARGPSQRLSAEMIRDNALAVSGLLVRNIGGPSVKPYDLPLAYTPLPSDKGKGLCRRSLYTFWKRTAPSPVMMTLNANRREVCRLRREVTSSPLQALVLLNGPQFVEAAHVLADNLLREHGDDDGAIADAVFRLLTSRHPTSREAAELESLLDEQMAHFEENPDQVKKLLSVGNVSRVDELPATRHAAVTVLVNSLMSFDESLRHQ